MVDPANAYGLRALLFRYRLADKGVDAFILREILGHTDIRTTVIYTHAANAAMHAAVGKLDEKKHLRNGFATNEKRQASCLP